MQNSSSQVTNDNHGASKSDVLSTSENDDGWHLVGTFKTTTADIKHYYVVPSKINIDNYVRSLLFK
jgi:hypothetical protein